MATPAHWWASHKKSITGWMKCHRLMIVHFGTTEVDHTGKYHGNNDPNNHLVERQTLWET